MDEDQELLPLSEAKRRFHELVSDGETRDRILMRHGRPVGALLGYRRYRALLEDARRGAVGSSRPGIAGSLRARADEIGRICRRHRVRRLAMFGSAARGDDTSSSDVDLVVEFLPQPPGERADAYFGLQADLERLIGRPVDLLEESAVQNPYLKEAVDRNRTVLYDAA